MSTVLGDDVIGRRLRTSLLRWMGADIEPGATVHGGGYVTNPSNLRLGRGTFINRNCYLDLEGPLILGRNVSVGHGTTFVTAWHDIATAENRAGPTLARSIEVGDGTWFGCNVTVLPGVVIGRGAVIGARSLVVRDVPDNAVVTGSPAKVQRILDS